jgi:hypothetical protein
MPQPSRVPLPNKRGAFNFFVKQNGNQIQLVRKIQLKQIKFEPEEYASVKSFFDIIIEKQGEQIVLKKVE